MYVDCHAHLFFSPIPIEAIDEDISVEISIPNRDNLIYDEDSKLYSNL